MAEALVDIVVTPGVSEAGPACHVDVNGGAVVGLIVPGDAVQLGITLIGAATAAVDEYDFATVLAQRMPWLSANTIDNLLVAVRAARAGPPPTPVDGDA